MKVLIVSATFLEIEPLLTHFNFVEQSNQKLRKYTFNTHQIDVLIPGVGMTCTAYWMGKTLNNTLYDFAINLGLAGSFNDEIKIGEVVNVVSDRISELGAQDGEKFLSLIDMDLIEDEDFTLVNGEMINSIPLENTTINKLRKVRAISVNTTHGEENEIEKVIKLFNPDVESMEGAAFYYACLLEGITCAQIRAISNKVEPRNKENWDIKLAVKNLTKTSLQLLKEL
ncbi:futalosine hydrolase [Vicingus serpentipes]|uniref:Futalosine hydrolase n=1 Tax=Vicingus serpentipes TaxID=1926625 RepID=A0A5C6RUZ7_9FLAO|nr:futalosine hydrolase [Vicingus serpentipes]TXB65350.1 futalosine hydrolase [Vicingus serpentipes]